MNKKTLLLLPLAALSLAACNPTSSSSAVTSSGDTYQMRWVTPTGAPTLAFYDQGANANWVSSSSPASVVVPAFKTPENYDAIVFDGTSGLNVLKSMGESAAFALVDWISGGNFYVVSTKHTATDAYQTGWTIESFVQSGNASKSFLKLASSAWNWGDVSSSTHYESGVAGVGTSLVGNPTGYDYYVIAEPILSSAKSALASKGTTLNVIYNLQTEWKKAYSSTIPAAALFVNKATYASHPDAVKTFVDTAVKRQDNAVNSIATVKTALDAYGNDAAVQDRFGYTSSLAVSLQSNGANKFGILKTGDIADNKAFANAYMSALGGAAFADSLFLSL